MLRSLICLSLSLFAVFTQAAVRDLSFKSDQVGTLPGSFRSTLTGEGKPSRWEVIMDDVPPLLAPITPDAPKVTKRAVMAHIGSNLADEHFPLLIVDDEEFADFTLTTRFKTVSGVVEQMAGIAFRIQDETNYYIIRASSLGNNLRFYKFVNGQRSQPIGPSIEIPKGTWHELKISCTGNKIRCWLNGSEAIPELTDNSFQRGKVGYWTKSDSTVYFIDTRLDYKPIQSLAHVLVKEMMQKYPRLLGVQIYSQRDGEKEVTVVASNLPEEIGKPATEVEKNIIANNVNYYGKGKKVITVSMPLHDRNGETIAAVRFTMDPFPGQTEQNALARALPLIQDMESRTRLAKDLFE